jgi:hypothetical protein
MGTARIALTVTHRVRTFLRTQGVDMRPWSGLDETYAGLYDLLREKRDDPDFWEPLSELLESVLAGASDAARRNLPTPAAELLESWDIDILVRDLRAALQRPSAPSVVGFASRLPQAAMGAFLVLGLVAAGGCATRSQSDSDGGSTTGSQDGTDGGDDGATDDGGTGGDGTGGDGTGDTGETSTGDVGTGDTGTPTHGGTGTGQTDGSSSGDTLTTGGSSGATQTDTTTLPGWAEDCDLDPDSVLFQTIDESDLSDYGKEDLCTCFAGLNADWNAGLTELFETETPQVIAAVLEEMLECCWNDPSVFDGDFAQSRDDLLSGNLCFVAPPYRGVTFPQEI